MRQAWQVFKVLLLWAAFFGGVLGAYDVASDVWVALGGLDFLAVCICELLVALVAVCWLLRYTLRELVQ